MEAVGADPAKNEYKLGDFVPNDKFQASTIRFVTGGGRNPTVYVEELDNEVEKEFIYVDENGASDGAGWYYTGDDYYEYNMNEKVKFAFGEGFCVYRNGLETDAALTLAGQVKKTPTTLDFPNQGYNCSGNCSPVEVFLKDITPNSAFQASTIRFITGGGRNPTLYVEELDNIVEKEFIYVDENGASDGAGWYYTGDDYYEYNMNEKVSFKAGEGFCVYRNGLEADAELEIPSALPAAE